jgi:hypothetical protein
VEDNQVTWADYVGNGLFMSLGNIAANPIASILVLNFETGEALQITGKAEVIFHKSANEEGAFDGSDRTVKLSVQRATFYSRYMPFQFQLVDYSPYNPTLMNTNAPAKDILEGEQLTLVKVKQESHNVKTFIFQTTHPITYTPGMYASFIIYYKGQKLVRTWTISMVNLEDCRGQHCSLISSNKFR